MGERDFGQVCAQGFSLCEGSRLRQPATPIDFRAETLHLQALQAILLQKL
jgi:hypothetical protein